MNGESSGPARYSELTAAIHAAGFFTSGIEDKDGCWDRVTVCSQNVGGIVSGNSFWIAELPTGWYLGAWGKGLSYSRLGSRRRVLCHMA